MFRVPRKERPWALCALFLLFVLISLYNEKNNPTSRAMQTEVKKIQMKQNTVSKSDSSHQEKYGNRENSSGEKYDDNQDISSGNLGQPINYDALPPVPSTDFNFCTAPHVLIRENNRTLDIPYQCDGPVYRSFIGHLRTFCDDMVTTGEQSLEWGHRTNLPPNRRYLFLGNSHTRQTAMALLCQLKVNATESLEPTNKAMARRYDLDNGSQIYLVVNSFVVHSPRWVELLEKQIGVKLTDFDAVVLGVFNTCNADVNTTFATDMKALQDEDSQVDCLNQEGPSLKQVAAIYSGPLLYVSMFATYRFKTYSQDKEDAIAMGSRSNLLYMDARQYIKLYDLEECGSPKRDEMSDCVNEEEARRYHHRCVGRFGGHPDLIAWDVIEFLYKHASR